MKAARLLATAVALTLTLAASADEGMWMIQDINEALAKNMKARGLRLSPGEIYNDEAPGTGVADAVVSIGFYCTGSVISDKGLIITNHHCAYSNIAKLSTPEHNYLENGYWAMSDDQEIPLPGEKVYFLKRVFDVTGEVKGLVKELRASGKPFGFRKISSSIESRYSKATGLDCSLSEMWGGEKYYISAYKVYTDVRLVAAPPLSIGYFGGSDDNWTWPRHNCDFAMYRIYEDGRPVTREKSLKVSLAGYSPGSFAMVIGYPGRTGRYTSPSSEITYQEEVELPVTNAIRNGRMEILGRWMDSDPQIRLKYSERYFALCNIVGSDLGKAGCFKRFSVRAEKTTQERDLRRWISAAPNRGAIWGDLLEDLEDTYSQTTAIERDKIVFRETIVRGGFIVPYLLRAGNMKDLQKAKATLREGVAATDARVEKSLLEYACRVYFSNLELSWFGRYQTKMADRFGDDYEAMADYLWDKSVVSSTFKIDDIESIEQIKNDPLRKFLTDVQITAFNNKDGQSEKLLKLSKLKKEYGKALYWMKLHKDVEQYPDANSTMRITYGTVGGLLPCDGVAYDWYTTPQGILQKYNPDNYNYHVDNKMLALLKKGRWGRWGFRLDGRPGSMVVDFLTDNDITGGNSGSPVLDADGNLIGLAFDGNQESLASDASYTQGYNKCINTDIRYVMWVLDRYAGMKHILREIEFVKK